MSGTKKAINQTGLNSSVIEGLGTSVVGATYTMATSDVVSIGEAGETGMIYVSHGGYTHSAVFSAHKAGTTTPTTTMLAGTSRFSPTLDNVLTLNIYYVLGVLTLQNNSPISGDMTVKISM
jgi:hypothetical protein